MAEVEVSPPELDKKFCRLARRKQNYERKHPGKIYPGPFTKEMLSAQRSGKNNGMFGKTHTEEAKEQHRVSVRNGVEDIDCPTIVPGSRTEQVILGSLLGDGSVLVTGKFVEKHCFEQRELVEVLHRLFEPFYLFKEGVSGVELTRIKTHVSSHHKKKYGIEKLQSLITLPRYPAFSRLRTQWYPEGKKIVPDEILDKIGPQALAWWYMGDGTYVIAHGNCRLQCQGFTPEDNLRLVMVLHRFGLTSAKVTNRNYIRLDRPDSSQKFLPLIAEYVVPTLRYKLGLLEPTYKPYNPQHYDPEPIITERMLGETLTEMDP